MADEDEIDILGDFSLDNLLSKNENEIYSTSGLTSHTSELLNCDCSSPWLTDHTSNSNSNCWYNNVHSDLCTDLVQEQDRETQISTENAVCDESGWTTKEKSLLERGIEIFGRSNVRLAQFIGSKTPTEVKHYLKHFYTNTQSCGINEGTVLDGNVIEETVVTSDIGDEVLDDSEIPASIEEIIAVVSTAQPTVQVNPKKSRKGSKTFDFSASDIPSGHSLLKSNVYKNAERLKKVSTSSIESQPYRKTKKDKDVKFKFSTKIKVGKGNGFNKKKFKKIPERVEVKNELKPLVLNINGEEVVKIRKENTEEDAESDIEIDVENDDNVISADNNLKQNLDNTHPSTPISTVESTDSENPAVERNVERDFTEWSDAVVQQLRSMEVPTCELKLSLDAVTDLEKCINSEFFEGRPTKTPNRYLKIRNYIINAWVTSKPSYVTKTSIRPGLKNCGDVNSIGRIHHFLEQIGAINFGCPQTTYIRPLYEMLFSTPTVREKTSKELILSPKRTLILNRPRVKRKFVQDGEGGCTLAHNEHGEVINTTVVNEEPIKQRSYMKRPAIRLIYCKPFTDEYPQKYRIHLYLSTLLLMDFHAHMSHTEVMGLIGGYWSSESLILTITRYVPCRNIAPSATHCDMCPLSQAKAADAIHGEGLDILGWFHSHPTFAPEPSQQDLDTQLSVQQWIGSNKPCIGLILSPFSAHGALIGSPYRCLIVDKKRNFEDQFLPFRFKVELVSSHLDVDHLLSQAWRTLNVDCNVSSGDQVDFRKPYFLDQSISYLDKFLSSVKMHLAKCSEVNKMTCDAIIEGFTNICSS